MLATVGISPRRLCYTEETLDLGLHDRTLTTLGADDGLRDLTATTQLELCMTTLLAATRGGWRHAYFGRKNGEHTGAG